MSNTPDGRIHSCNCPAISRADEMLCKYYTVVSPFMDEDEYPPRSLIDKPSDLQDTMQDVIADLRHAADAAGISWSNVLAEADKSYGVEQCDADKCGELRPQ